MRIRILPPYRAKWFSPTKTSVFASPQANVIIFHRHSTRRQTHSVVAYNSLGSSLFRQYPRNLFTAKRCTRPRFFWRRNTKHTSKQPQKRMMKSNATKPTHFRSVRNACFFNVRSLRCRTRQQNHTVHHKIHNMQNSSGITTNRFVAQHQVAAETAWSGNNNCNIT